MPTHVHVYLHDKSFEESKHPRDAHGEFSKTRGTGAAAALTTLPRDSWPEHVKALKLPPAWIDVRVNPDPSAALQAIGYDQKGRAQYVYSEAFSASQSALKFQRIQVLEQRFGELSRQNERDRASDNQKVKDVADCVYLVMETGVRPGGDDDTRAKVKAYGASTLEGRHVVTEGKQTYLRFTGKKGVALDLPVEGPVAAMLQKRATAAGADGRLFGRVNASTLLDYVHGLDASGFKTKDFRTLLASRTASHLVVNAPKPVGDKAYKAAVLQVAKTVSAKLGNTPTVALQSYINPAVFAPWRATS